MKLERVLEAYEPPFLCDNENATVLDQKGNTVITIRGWSRLSQLFDSDDAFALQLEIAHFLAGKLNEIQNTGMIGNINKTDGELLEEALIYIDTLHELMNNARALLDYNEKENTRRR